MKRTALCFALVALVLLWPGATASADEPVVSLDNGRIFVGEDVWLEPAQVFQGDLGIFDGDLHMPEGSSVHGDVFLVDGNAYVDGLVDGDLAVVSGNLELAETAQVRGTLFAMGGEQSLAGLVRGDVSVLFGDVVLRSTVVIEGDLLAAPGKLDREAGSQVRGEVVHNITQPSLPFLAQEESELPAAPNELQPQPSMPHRDGVGQALGRLIGRILTASLLGLLLIAIGAVIVFVWPRQTGRVADCISAAPVRNFALGLLTYLIAAGLEVVALVLMILIIFVAALMIGTVVLIPVGIFLLVISGLVLLPVPLALVGAIVLGWVGLARRIGERVLDLFRVRGATSVGAVFAGLLITVPIAALLWVIKPICCAWPFVILLTSVGLGASFHTRFGAQDCVSGTPRPAHGAVAEDIPDDGGVLPLEAMDDEAGRPDLPIP